MPIEPHILKRTKNENRIRKFILKGASGNSGHLKEAHLNDQRTRDTCFFRHLKSFKSASVSLTTLDGQDFSPPKLSNPYIQIRRKQKTT